MKFLVTIFLKNFSTSTKFNDDIFFKINEYLKKEKDSIQLKKLKFKQEVKFDLIKLGNLDFNLIKYKINISNTKIEAIEEKKKKKNKDKNIDFNYFSIKITNDKIEYTILYVNFIKERNIFYILFTVLIGKVVEISITYVFNNKILNYFIFYEIFIQNFFSFINRVLNEIKVFELYLYDKDSIIPKALIHSINISILKKIPDKLNIKYI